ncbi:MAG: tRNA uridine-5-carboxymethylaminomethyl(34) synthesis GTPase MnmE [Fervidobacterium sp.]|uniref:tRNA modification GTPase MnmE n=1 Tax=Fervidobacterium gondwanense DSM 13020 TaxID=1121883 RepID=A0A1M7S532_FERGO|nr:tRNA uridine-5-carboxymethylaminomethyl(34) synthesis GTPase MnmE [Fervidobacterium gondwanense]SHN53445.1 tRNA modification GTPase trmE [Fervidobacterium gondwanense DSM 13020]
MAVETAQRDTIVAIATPPGTGAIGIVRMSGERSWEIIQKCVRKSIYDERRILYGNFYDTDGNVVDEILFVGFKAPKSYTGEDMVEVYCHGGVLVTQKILAELIRHGARLAKNGEFTRRAFLNGKIDLIKAESILQIIEAKSEESLRLAIDNLKGKLSEEINRVRNSLINILSKIEVSIDYGDDIEVPRDEIMQDIADVEHFLSDKLAHADKGIHISTGVTLAIIGKPNVGKSTLLNRLLLEDRAIVTDIPGTTRDIIKGEIKIQGIHFVISDTAGIRHTDDFVEKIGIERAIKEASQADVVIFLLDATTGFTKDDQYILNIIKDSNFIPVWNKIDSGNKVIKVSKNNEDILLSASSGVGLRELEAKIVEKAQPLVAEGQLSHITSKRQIEHLKLVNENVVKAMRSLRENYPLDIISIDIRNALSELDKLLGRNFTDDLLENIFANFCVGK